MTAAMKGASVAYYDDHHRKRIITIDVNSVPVILVVWDLLNSPQYAAINTNVKRANTILATLRRYAESSPREVVDNDH